MTTWIGIALTIMCLLVAQTMPASQPTGPRDAVEAAVARFMNIMQNARSDGAAMTADRLGEIRGIVREIAAQR